MKTLKIILPLACMLLLSMTAIATPIAYPFRITDNSGALVAGAAVSIGATVLTAGSAITVPAAAGEKLLTTNTAPGVTVSITLLDFGTGDYALVYDPATQGELYIPLTVSKAGSTITGGAALIALVASADSSQVAKIGQNVMDSPNEIVAQTSAASTNIQTTPANQQLADTNASIALGYTAARAIRLDSLDALVSSRMATFTYLAPANPTDYQQRAVSVTLPAAPAGYGGSGSGADTPGTTILLSRLGTPAGATFAADIAAVKGDTAGLTTSTGALTSSVAALPTAAATAAAVMNSSFLTLPGSATTSTIGLVLTYKQVQSLIDSVSGGDNVTSGPPVASGTATVTYYLRGQVHSSSTITEVATVAYDANKQQISRTVKISQPFPAVN